MIRVWNNQIEDTNDPAILLKECEMSFAECERTYFEMMSLHDFDGWLESFEEEIVRKVPLHV